MAIKVLHLIDSGGLYGAEMMLLNLVEEQVKSGLKPLILSAGTLGIEEKAIEAEARKRGLPVKSVRMKAGINVVKAFQIVSFAKKEGFDVLHSHGYKFNILLGMLPERVRKMPIATTIHGYIPAKKISKLAIYQWLDRALIKNFDDVIFVNKHMLEQSFFINAVFKKFSVINNGINVEREVEKLNVQRDFTPDSSVSDFLDGSSLLLGTISRLSQGKGVQDLIVAFKDVVAKYPSAKLLVVGDGYYQSVLEDLVDSCQLTQNIMFTGYSDKTYYYLLRFDVFVLPSHSEGLPMILLEAMIAEKLIVSTNVGGIPEVLNNGANGILVEPKAPKKLADALITLCKELQDGVNPMAKNKSLKDEVMARFSSEMMASSYAGVYKSITTIG